MTNPPRENEVRLVAMTYTQVRALDEIACKLSAWDAIQLDDLAAPWDAGITEEEARAAAESLLDDCGHSPDYTDAGRAGDKLRAVFPQPPSPDG